MNQVAVKLRPDIAASIDVAPKNEAQPSDMPSPAADVVAVLQEHGADLGAMHPSTTDPDLGAWFIVEVDGNHSATELAASLLELDGVEAAYEQGPAETPDLLP